MTFSSQESLRQPTYTTLLQCRRASRELEFISKREVCVHAHRGGIPGTSHLHPRTPTIRYAVYMEALVIFYALKRFHQYLYSRQFTILSDHKPLKYLFGEIHGSTCRCIALQGTLSPRAYSSTSNSCTMAFEVYRTSIA